MGWRWKRILREGDSREGKPVLIFRAVSCGFTYAKIRITTPEEKFVATFEPGRSTHRVLDYGGSLFYWKHHSGWKKDRFELTDVAGTLLAELVVKNWEWNPDKIITVFPNGASLPKELVTATATTMYLIEVQRRANNSGAASAGSGSC